MKLLKRLNDKGFLSIEIVIGVFIFIMVMCCLVDVSIMLWKHNVISQTNSHMARTVSFQGGISTSPGSDFPGGSKAYVTSAELYQDIKKSMESAGFKDNKNTWSVTINGHELTESTDVKVPLNKKIHTKLTATCSWTLMSKLIPGTLTKTIVSKRVVLSNYQERFNDATFIKAPTN